MSGINFDKFLNWAESRFSDVVVKGNEIKINSIFCDDDKFHLWCNPVGGKKNRKNGVFHCWKTDIRGSLITLVMKVDKCSYQEALEILGCGHVDLRDFDRLINEFFDQKNQIEEPPSSDLKLPDHVYRIEYLPENDLTRINAEMYLLNRKLKPQDFMVCTAGKYYPRIVIPYYDREGKLIYFNSRTPFDNKKTSRYLGPPKEIGVGKSDVLYLPKWARPGSEIHLTEGEFDAYSLFCSGLYSAALGGKELGENQVAIIREEQYIPVLCLDNDKSGGPATRKLGEFLLTKGFRDVYYVRPPVGIKDWNKMLVDYDIQSIKDYVFKHKKRFSINTALTEWIKNFEFRG